MWDGLLRARLRGTEKQNGLFEARCKIKQTKAGKGYLRVVAHSAQEHCDHQRLWSRQQ